MIRLVAFSGLAAWTYLILFHRGFWRADQRLPAACLPLAVWPAVTALVPARNEAETIAEVVAALLAQDYPGAFRVVVIDDASTDGTAEVARGASARPSAHELDVIATPPLAAGWTGKLWALNAGVTRAVSENAPAYLWFTDADIVHQPATLKRLVSKAVTDRRALVSLMAHLRCESFWERRLIPAFIFFFQMLYSFAAVSDDRARIGGLNTIRGRLIDDCALAEAIKRSGGGLWLGLADASRSLRRAESLQPLWAMVRRTAFT